MSAPAPLPLGPEREVTFIGGATIGGAPVSSVIVLAAVVAVLSFIPFSIALSAGSSFPVAQGVYSLTGWLLGPWAGAVTSGTGALVGVLLAPHTAGVPWITVGGAAAGAIFAGAIVPGKSRRPLAFAVALVLLVEVVLFTRHAVVVNGVRPLVFFLGYLTHFAAMALFILPTRAWMGRLIASPDLKQVALGLFLGTWTAASLMMFSESMVSYLIFNWPGELFVLFAGIVPLEHAARSAIGAIVGTGVISGLRAMALVKPREAAY
jgi:hypothetical protein